MQCEAADRQGRSGHGRITGAHRSDLREPFAKIDYRAERPACDDDGSRVTGADPTGGRFGSAPAKRDAASPNHRRRDGIGGESLVRLALMQGPVRVLRSPQRRRWLGALVLAAILTPSTAAAWHDDGHRIVGEIAERRLSDQARARAAELLADVPGYDTLASAATWADQQAKLDSSFDFMFSSHYVNLDEQLTPRELLELCLQRSGCVATGTAYYVEILRSARASKAQRGEALRFLIHFVGDAHQPLHAGRSGDRGGNDIDGLRLLEYTPGAERTNLHAVWDGGLASLAMTRAGWDWRRYAIELDGRVTDAMARRWGRGSVYDWLEESRLFADANGYLHADGFTPIRSRDSLGEDWVARNLEVVEQRLQQAGVRLAAVLEELLGDAPLTCAASFSSSDTSWRA
jgi:nuclease S1